VLPDSLFQPPDDNLEDDEEEDKNPSCEDNKEQSFHLDVS
jgi:hypothetical protein